VTVVRLLALAIGVLVVASLPCWVVLICTADEVFAGAWRRVSRALRRPGRRRLWAGQSWRQRRRLAQLARTVTESAGKLPTEPADPPIEQVAADLRRLANQRAAVARRSEIWFAAIERAYDDRLRVACRELRLEEHLTELDGIDREIERVRVEGSVQAAGVDLGLHGIGGCRECR
jgi:hypothetical protein